MASRDPYPFPFHLEISEKETTSVVKLDLKNFFKWREREMKHASLYNVKWKDQKVINQTKGQKSKTESQRKQKKQKQKPFYIFFPFMYKEGEYPFWDKMIIFRSVTIPF